ncbi:glycosyltransferase [bacterium]|nr:glycosyltransferase [bacterium]
MKPKTKRPPTDSWHERPSVLHVIGPWRMGGAEKQLSNVASRAVKRGWRAEILVLGDQWDESLVRIADPCPVVTLPNRPRGSARHRALAEKVRREDWPLLAGQLFTGNLYAVAAAKRTGRKAIAFEGGLEPWRRWYHWAACRWYWRRAALIEVNSRAVGEMVLSRGGPESKLRVIYNGIEAGQPVTPDERREARDGLGLNPGPVVVMVANLRYPKDPQTLVRSVARLKDTYPGIKTLLVGDGHLRSAVERLIGELGLKEEVTLLGRIDDVRPLLAAADVFCHSSLSEGLPNAVIEAQVAGVPCVVSKAGGSVELILDEERGLTFEIGEVNGCAAAITRLLDDPADARRMAENSRIWAIEELSFERNLERHRRLYEEALGIG